MIAPDIQKDFVHATVIEVTNVIINDLGDGLFAILLDESRDVSIKKQVTVVLRYLDFKGCIVERFLGIVHVIDTTALSLKATIAALFSKHNLSVSRLRRQGYDGASNMQGEYNGLKTLIMKENASAYYVHCFAHQLQLALVVVAKNHVHIALLFNLVARVVNGVGASCKRRDILREKQFSKVIEALQNGEFSSGIGLNQETNLQQVGDTRWSSHYGSLIRLIDMFASVIDVLEIILEDGINLEQSADACALLDSIQSFNFAFNLYLMKNILRITNELSLALQRKDQDIVNSMRLVQVAKERLQAMRDNG